MGSVLVRLWDEHYHHVGVNGAYFDEGLSWTLPLCGYEWGLLWWGSIMDTATMWVWIGSAIDTVTMWIWIGSAVVRVCHGHYHHVGVNGVGNGVVNRVGLPQTLSLYRCEWSLLLSWTLAYGCEWGLLWWGSVIDTTTMWVCFDESLPTIIWVWMRSALVRLWHGHCHHVGMNRVRFDESLPWMLPLCGCEWGLFWWGSVIDTTTIWVWMGSALVRVCLPSCGCDRVYFGWGSALVRLWHGHCHHVGVNRVCFDEGLPWTLPLCGCEWGLLLSWTLACEYEWGLLW